MATEAEFLEVFRLGEAAGDAEVVRVVGDRLAGVWLGWSRVREVQNLAARSLAVQTSATTLMCGGLASHRLGDRGAALLFYEEALAIRREVGDRAGEAVTRYNIAMIHRDAGRLAEAVQELEITVALDRAVQHPDLEADTAILEKVRAEITAAE